MQSAPLRRSTVPPLNLTRLWTTTPVKELDSAVRALPPLDLTRLWEQLLSRHVDRSLAARRLGPLPQASALSALDFAGLRLIFQALSRQRQMIVRLHGQAGLSFGRIGALYRMSRQAAHLTYCLACQRCARYFCLWRRLVRATD